jgi:hypothetical protein
MIYLPGCSRELSADQEFSVPMPIQLESNQARFQKIVLPNLEVENIWTLKFRNLSAADW